MLQARQKAHFFTFKEIFRGNILHSIRSQMFERDSRNLITDFNCHFSCLPNVFPFLEHIAPSQNSRFHSVYQCCDKKQACIIHQGFKKHPGRGHSCSMVYRISCFESLSVMPLACCSADTTEFSLNNSGNTEPSGVPGPYITLKGRP